MENPEKDLRKLIRKTLQEMNDISESDLLVRAGVNWDEAKPKFLEKINNLVAKIDDDQYDDADNLIGSVTAMLKMWRAKIKKGKNDMVDKVSYSETLDEEQLDEYFGGPSKEEKTTLVHNLASTIDEIMIREYFDKEELKDWINNYVDNKLFSTQKPSGFM